MTRSKSRAELAVDLLTAYRWILALVGVVALVAFMLVRPTIPLPQVTIPRVVKVAFVAALSAAVLGFIPASKALDWLYDPPRRYVVCLGLKSDAEPGLWRLSPASWEQVTVTDGELYEWPGTTWPTYEVEAFDPDALEAEGTWRGSKPDSELLRKEKEIDHVRQTLEQQADTSIDTEISISSKVRQAVREIGRALIDEHAQATTYEGERVADVLSEIRQEVEEDSGSDSRENGEKPTQEHDALRMLDTLADATQEVSNGEQRQ